MKKFRVTQEPCKGRAAIAVAPLSAGSQLLSTDAYAAVSLNACNWCFTRSAVKRCNGCQLIKYCSRQCQQRDWALGGHGKECGSAWKQIPRKHASQTILLVARLAAKLLLSDSDGETKDAVLDLRHHYDDHTSQKLREFQEMAQLVVLILSRSKFNTASLAFETLSERYEDAIVQLFCRVNCNAFTICDDANVPVGIGLFPQAALLNHSCEPNCVVSFASPQRLQIQVITAVQPGEELTISYVELLESRTKRRQALRASYFFECTCPRCLHADQHPQEDWFLDGYACQSGACSRDDAVVVTIYGPEAVCKQCGHVANTQAIHDGLSRLDKTEQELAMASSLQQQWTLHERVWQLVHQHIPCHPRSTRYANAARRMGNFLIDHGDAVASLRPRTNQLSALDFLQKEQEASAWVLPTLALPSRGLLSFQLAKLSLTRASKHGTERYIREALAVLSVAYGSNHRMVHAAHTFLHELSSPQ